MPLDCKGLKRVKWKKTQMRRSEEKENKGTRLRKVDFAFNFWRL